MRRLRLAFNLYRDHVLCLTWRRAWRKSGDLA